MRQEIVGLILVASAGCEQPQGYIGSCGKIAAEYRSQFELECRQKTDGELHNGSLEEIVEQGKFVLQQVGCKVGCEQWTCGRGNYFGQQRGEYTMSVVKSGTCYR